MTSGTNDRTFVDTNVLIYAHDVDAGRKHEVAEALLRDLWAERAGVLSTQVLQEFYVNVTRKIRTPLPRPAARGVVSTYASWSVDVTAADVEAAFRLEDDANATKGHEGFERLRARKDGLVVEDDDTPSCEWQVSWKVEIRDVS